MIRLCKIFCISVLSFILVSEAYGQARSGPAADADKAFNTFQYTLAAELYKKAYGKIKRNPVEKRRVMFRMAECYTMTGNLKLAKRQYQRLEKINYQKDNPLIFMRLGDIYRIERDYPNALKYYEKYQKAKPEDPRSEGRIESCKVAPEWLNNPTRHEVENFKRFNSPLSDWSPSWGVPNKENQIVFTSSREGSTGKKEDVWSGQSFSDFYVSNKPKSKIVDFPGEWTTPVLLDNAGIINSAANEGESSFNPKGTTIYFTRCLDEKKMVSHCKIYQATKKGRSWSEPELIVLGPDSFDYVHPVISSDELTLYFVSDVTGTLGGYDVWKTTRSKKNKPFETPENLCPNVNSYDHEMFPSLVNDTSLYFASKGHVGLGGYDIFVSHKKGDDWTKAENLKYPINSEADDYGIIFDQSNVLDPISGFPFIEKGFFSSNRAGGRGEDDIWIFKLRPLMFTLSGFVRDSVTRQFVDGATVTITGSNGKTYRTKTDIRGYYNFDKTKIVGNTTYEISVQKTGYYENDNSKGRETTVGLTENKDLKREFIINPIPKEPVVLPDILYDLGKWDLKPQYQDSLMGLYKIMKDNPTLVIELRSHTDIRPIPMTNDTLSQRRAESCVAFLIDSLGVEPQRLVAKGYGERIPRTLMKDVVSRGVPFKKGTVLTPEYIKSLPKNQQEAAHALNRRTEFLILRDDYVPSTKVSDVSQSRVQIMTQKYIPIESKNGETRATAYVNSKTVKFLLQANTDSIYISFEQAMKFLKDAIFTVGDFEAQASAIDEKDGSIINGSIVFFKTLQIGDEVIENVEAKVVKGQKDALIIGRDVFIEEFGSYYLSEKEQKLIFE